MAWSSGGNVVYHGYSDPSPYPEIRVLSQNRQYANLLLDSYAGPQGEFSAMSQYFYQRFASGGSDGFGLMSMRIGIAELHHMEMLAGVILLLGGTLPFHGSIPSNRQFWTARNIHYGKNLCDMLQSSYNGELRAIRNYENSAQRIEDPYVRAIIHRIVIDEQLHARYLQQMIQKHCK